MGGQQGDPASLLQIVGKIRLVSAPRRNHWWHIAFHLTGRGITTRPMGSDPIFAIDFDFVDHRLVINTVDGSTAWFSLPGISVASFYEQMLTLLGGLGIGIVIERPEPFDLTDTTRLQTTSNIATTTRFGSTGTGGY